MSRLITFGLGGSKAGVVRLGFGATALQQQPAIGGGVLFRPRPQWQPAAWRPIPQSVETVSRIRIGLRVRSITTAKSVLDEIAPFLDLIQIVPLIERLERLERLSRETSPLGDVAAEVVALQRRVEVLEAQTKRGASPDDAKKSGRGDLH